MRVGGVGSRVQGVGSRLYGSSEYPEGVAALVAAGAVSIPLESLITLIVDLTV